MSDPLQTLFAPEVVKAIERLVVERVEVEVQRHEARLRLPTWLTVDEAAEHARCSRRTIQARLARGQIEGGHVGARRLVRRSSLDAFIGDDSMTVGARGGRCDPA